MKNKILIIILIVLIILLAFFCAVKLKKENSSIHKTTRDFIMTDTPISTVNTSGENSGIYIGVTENENQNYLFVSIKIDKKASKENQIKSLISEISTATGYQINTNSIEINENEIKIDFSNKAAPFELEESYHQTDAQKYFITSKNLVAKTIFDSIDKTLKSYFGESTQVYYTVDSEEINITNEILTINIDSNKPYGN